MSLSELQLQTVYRSASGNLLREFYLPCLSRAIRYDRAVGFFSASMLSYAAQGLTAFIKNNGKMRLVVGAVLDVEEEEAIIRGLAFREAASSPTAIKNITSALIHNLQGDLKEVTSRRLSVLEMMISEGLLEVKVAVRRRGMFHEKIGMLVDENNNWVAFQGSANETTYGLAPDFNFESVNVFRSWREGDEDHAKPHFEFFESLWNNEVDDTFVLSIPDPVIDEVRRRNLKYRGKNQVEDLEPLSPEAEVRLIESKLNLYPGPKVPEGFSLKGYQQSALRFWQDHGFSSILAMATGTGKTKTALYAASKLFEVEKRQFLIVSVPYKNLAEQWCANFIEFNISPIKCYGNANQWRDELDRAVYEYRHGLREFSAVVVVNRTMASSDFQKMLKRLSDAGNVLFIGDECHGLGAPQMMSSVPVRADKKLGLSATFERHGDEEGTKFIEQYFGSSVFRFGLREAMMTDPPALCPYDYFVHFVELTATEADQYVELSRKIARMVALGGGDSKKQKQDSNNALEMLLFKRARLLGAARNKILKLVELFKDHDPGPLTLIYCGDGSVENDSPEEGDEEFRRRQIDEVVKAIATLGKRVGRYTYSETPVEQRLLLEGFRDKQIDVLTAIRCLDEGIDIPACETAFILASSRNPRQFIQRRGRVLRLAAGKKKATIHDFMVGIPPVDEETARLEKLLMQGELSRVYEFAKEALNSSEVFASLEEPLEKYDLFDVFLSGGPSSAS